MAKTSKSNIIGDLRAIFLTTTTKVKDTGILTPVPAEKTDNGIRKLKMTDEYLKLYQYWLKDVFDTSLTVKDRFERYKALEYAFYNNSIFSKSVNLYADETIQEDVQAETVDVDAPDKKVINYIKEFFLKTGIDQEKIKDVAFNLSLYGDAFWIGSTEPNEGYKEFIPASVYNIIDRLEFNAAEEKKKMNKNNKFNSYIQSDNRLKVLNSMLITDNDNLTKAFKTYLFGFQVSKDTLLPPWNVFHFRVFTSQSEFTPWGRPIMINSLAPFRQLQSSKNLMSLGRAMGFPVKVFDVKSSDSLDPMSQWEAVNAAREQYSNITNEISGKEEFTMNSELWLPENQVSMKIWDSNINMDRIADVEMLRDDLIMGTDIPKGYLIVDRGAFGSSSQSLLAQYKPFARKVYDIQQAILKTIADAIRLEFIISGKFKYDTPFELSMAYPSTEESADRLRIKSDTLRLAKDVLETLGSAMGLERGESLPPEIAKSVLTKYSFMDGEDIEEWVKLAMANTSKEISEKGRNKINSRLNEQIISETYFNCKRRMGLREGIIGQKHYYSSFNIKPQENDLYEAMKPRDPDKKIES